MPTFKADPAFQDVSGREVKEQKLRPLPFGKAQRAGPLYGQPVTLAERRAIHLKRAISDLHPALADFCQRGVDHLITAQRRRMDPRVGLRDNGAVLAIR